MSGKGIRVAWFCPECGKPVKVQTHILVKPGEPMYSRCQCAACGYESPRHVFAEYPNGKAEKRAILDEAVRLHNAICRQPTPEAEEAARAIFTMVNELAILHFKKHLLDVDILPVFDSIIAKLAHPPKPEPTEARELNLKWGRHDGRGEYHIEWHAPCGCAYHPEPKPHVHPCIKHSQIEDALHDLREMWLNFPGLSFGSLSIPCIQEMSPEQADFYEKACEIAKASPAAVSGDKQEKERG